MAARFVSITEPSMESDASHSSSDVTFFTITSNTVGCKKYSQVCR
ncbi:hypothetical protein FOQG_14769 [Fusarium oxysporum f. sp. raphani 54005]|uniref:Uncharacterized protein n=2 Tax=Fusarium oxysporum TaxID=5507 RepID=X0BFZ9_FUSOX|nr:hypothetical protein FOVG_18968 [Fusarium oxysporum f. sp. pisi HDV247]EXK80721.1 hypothetical protein FOQG_14769 [Fusarium oxysporum f. sp. raphani 54005]